ncbi:MAG: hypothetical protein CM1200mP26_10070 [Acidimicrobiales bacterium]|nr:MAG: hypothetical protein CM1200mP26_10070 [Acidimicrobiales bacterium]
MTDPESAGPSAASTQDPSRVPPIDDWHRLLDGRVAVVTGGGAGIGGAISRLFGAHGALVEVVDSDPDRSTLVVEDIEAAGGVARAHMVDVRSDAEVRIYEVRYSANMAGSTYWSTTSETTARWCGSTIPIPSRGQPCTPPTSSTCSE